jgi:hypothetical protein
MGKTEHDAKQFTQDELKVINEALIFTLNCLDREQVQLYNSIELVLAKTTGLLKED